MQAPDTSATPPHSSPLPAERLRTRLGRLSIYFGNQRLAWSLAIAGTLVGALTEPLLAALLHTGGAAALVLTLTWVAARVDWRVSLGRKVVSEPFQPGVSV